MHRTNHGTDNSLHAPASPIAVLATALVLGLSLAAVDVLAAIPSSPETWADSGEVFAPFAGTAAPVTVGFLFVWYLIVAPLLRLFRLDAGLLVVSLAAFPATTFSLLAGQHLFRSNMFAPKFLFQLVLTLAVGVLVSLSVYSVLHKVSPVGWALRICRKLCLAAPFVLIWTLAYRWENYVDSGSLLSDGFPYLTAAFGAVVAVTVWLLFRLSLRANTILLVLLFIASLAFGGVALHQRSDYIQAASAGFVESKHDIPRVILISVDTLRSDTLSCYNQNAPPTPHVDQLAVDSVVFKNASSAAPWTVPSVVSLMTGIPPFAHRVSRPEARLPDEFPTLAESMRDAGYLTAAVAENYFLQPKFNVHKGFQEFAHFPKLWPWYGDAAGRYFLRLVFPSKFRRGGTEVVTQSAQKWLEENRGKDFFFWIHYLDPHVPYSPPSHLLPGTRPPERIGTSFDLGSEVRGGMFLTAEERAWIKQLYLAEVRFVDENIGLLLNTLKQLGLYDNSLIVLMSDHGEEFWEHGGYGHGHSLCQEVISVPLIIKLPNSTTTGTVTTRVSNQFVMPTILELCGIPDHGRCYSAPSLVPLWSGKGSPEGHNILLSSGALYYEDMEAVLFDNHKFIRFVSSEREELYDLISDPRETSSIHASAAKMADRGRHTLEEQRRVFSKVRDCYGPVESEAPSPGAELKRQLKSLGYIQ